GLAGPDQYLEHGREGAAGPPVRSVEGRRAGGDPGGRGGVRRGAGWGLACCGRNPGPRAKGRPGQGAAGAGRRRGDDGGGRGGFRGGGGVGWLAGFATSLALQAWAALRRTLRVPEVGLL